MNSISKIVFYLNIERIFWKRYDLVRNHPLIPKDINVRGYIMDSVTGGLRAIEQL